MHLLTQTLLHAGLEAGIDEERGGWGGVLLQPCKWQVHSGCFGQLQRQHYWRTEQDKWMQQPQCPLAAACPWVFLHLPLAFAFLLHFNCRRNYHCCHCCCCHSDAAGILVMSQHLSELQTANCALRINQNLISDVIVMHCHCHCPALCVCVWVRETNAVCCTLMHSNDSDNAHDIRCGYGLRGGVKGREILLQWDGQTQSLHALSATKMPTNCRPLSHLMGLCLV